MVENFGFSIVGFVVVIGFLIFVHESGHFLFAKLFRVRVLTFSFGFGKRLFGFRKGDTDYRVSLIPLGGYVRMAGDLSRPKWQRFIILFAGPAMNVLVALAFMAGIAMIGYEQVIAKPVVAAVAPNKPAARAGLQQGDVIVAVQGEPVKDFADVRTIVEGNAGMRLRVDYRRDGVTRTTTLTPERTEERFGPVGRAGIDVLEPLVGRVLPGSPAAAAGIRAGDRILSANGQPVRSLNDYAAVSDEAKTAPVVVQIARGAQRLTVNFAPSSDPKLTLLRGVDPPRELFKLSLVPAVKYSVNENWRMLRRTFFAIGRLFRSEGSVKELSGPINIARISAEALRSGWLTTIALMAMISLQLGVMNLLPIPVLDGGHIMILLIEGIARRELSLRVKERIQQAGFAVLATLMIVVLYNDVISNVLRIRKG